MSSRLKKRPLLQINWNIWHSINQKFRHRTNKKFIEINSLNLLLNFRYLCIDHHYFLGGGTPPPHDWYLCKRKQNRYLFVCIHVHTFRCIWLTQDLRNFIVVQFVFKGPEVYLCWLTFHLNSSYKWKVIFYLNKNFKKIARSMFTSKLK